jgi:hypothetical protein
MFMKSVKAAAAAVAFVAPKDINVDDPGKDFLPPPTNI